MTAHGEHSAKAPPSDSGDAANWERKRVHTHRTGSSVRDSIDSLGLVADRGIVVVGATRELSETDHAEATRLTRHSLLPVVADGCTLVIDGGTDCGVFQIVGQVLSASSDVTILGIAPKGRVYFPSETSIPGGFPAEPNHSCFLLAESDRWGGETDLLVEVVDLLSSSLPVAVVALGGGSGTEHEIRELARRGHPAIIVDLPSSAPVTVGDVGDGLEEVSRLLPPVRGAELRRAIRWRLVAEQSLRQAWSHYLAFDRYADAARASARSLPRLILWLGVLTMCTAVLALDDDVAGRIGLFALSILPAFGLALVAWTLRSRNEARWIVPRAVAEALLSTIYRYRARVGKDGRPLTEPDAGALLATSLAEASAIVEREGLPAPGPWRPDWAALRDGQTVSQHNEMVGPLTGDEYVLARVQHQYDYHSQSVTTKARRARRWSFSLVGVGVAGVVAGAIAGLMTDDWRILPVGAVILALYGAVSIATWIEYHQWDELIRQSESMRGYLRRTMDDWESRSSVERADPRASRALVSEIEDEFERENTEWRRRLRQSGATFARRTSGQV